MNADCLFSEDVHAFLTGALTPVQKGDFERHLTGCADCRASVASTRRLLGTLRAVPQVACSRDLGASTLALIHAEPTVPEVAVGPSKRIRLATLAAALVGAASLASSMW